MSWLDSKNVFLFDGIGATVSTLFAGFLLPRFSLQIGVTTSDLYCLASLAFIYSIYSFYCYKFVAATKPWMLIGIILANGFYCSVSSGIIFFYRSLTVTGAVLFSMEIFVVLLVIGLELNVYRKYFKSNE